MKTATRLALFVLAVAVIAALTFPWRLEDHSHWGNVRWWPFGAGIVRPHDILGNFLLYVPLGLTMPVRSRWSRVAAAGAVGLVLSLGIETAQIWSHYRVPSLLDILLNVTGALLGAALRDRRSDGS